MGIQAAKGKGVTATKYSHLVASFKPNTWSLHQKLDAG